MASVTESPYLTPTVLKLQIVLASEKHTATVIFLHGLGDRGAGMSLYAKQMSAEPGLRHVKWIMPDAPMRPLTAGRGMIVPSWFDVFNFNIFTREEDEPSLLAGATAINTLISNEIEEHGIPPERIIVGGLSQGGALACLTGVTSERRLAGVFVLSSYVPLWRKTREIATSIAPSIPIFWGHGTVDAQVDHDMAFTAASNLAQVLNIPIRMVVDEVKPEKAPLSPKDPGIRFNSYKGLVHWIDPEDELADLVVWIQGVVPMGVC